MDSILKLAKQYSREEHIKDLLQIDSNLLKSMNFIYDTKWEINPDESPYEVLTYLLDCYYCLPSRPDLASLFCWQAINHSYNEFLLNDSNIQKLSDVKGLMHLKKYILDNYTRKYQCLLTPYIEKLPMKVYRYISSYMLKGYVMELYEYDRKYWPNAYVTISKRLTALYDIVSQSYGKALAEISNPILQNNKIVFNIEESNKDRSRKITYSFARKIQQLVLDKKTAVMFKNNEVDERLFAFTDDDVLTVLLFGVMYASRCNNFHGNAASRMNSINADKETFQMYTDIFLIEYIFLAISLNIQNRLSDAVLNKIGDNSAFML